MFSFSILLVFGVIINANGHLIMKLLHKMHEKMHPNYGHHSSIAGGYPPFEPKPQLGPENSAYGPPPINWFPAEHVPQGIKCRYQPCHLPYPNNGQSPYIPNTININNINANSQQDATSISSQLASDVNVNGMTTASNVPNHLTGIHGHGSDLMTNSQSAHGVNQENIYYAAVPSGHSTNHNTNNAAFSSSTSQKGLSEFGSMFGSNLNNLATLNGQANHLTAQTTNFNSQTTKLNSETTNMNVQTTNFNGNSNNAILDTTNQFGVDKNAFNAMNHVINGAGTTAANSLSNNVHHLNNNIHRTQTVPAYTELPPASSTTNRAGMEYNIDIRFGDNQ